MTLPWNDSLKKSVEKSGSREQLPEKWCRAGRHVPVALKKLKTSQVDTAASTGS